MLKRARRSLAFRLLGRAGVAELVESKGPSIRDVRMRVVDDLNGRFGGTVAYGPFKGLKLPASHGWNTQDRAGLLLGLYEKELLETMAALFSTPAPFVDVGAADGYYCVGALHAGWCDRAVAFEASPERQELIRETAALNGVGDRITVLGAAGDDMVETASAALGVDIGRARWLIDIEGGEFSVLTDSALAALAGSTVFVEVHKWGDPTGEKRDALWSRAGRHFLRSAIETGPRDLSAYPELAELPDDERWLICSERRRLPGLWWRFDSRTETTTQGEPDRRDAI